MGSYLHPGSQIGVIVEVNCESDFVARTPDFVQMVHDVAMQICATDPRFVRKEEVPAEALELAVPNVELTWRMDATMIERVKIYSQQMLELKQIRALPNFATFLAPKFNDEIAQAA